MESTERQLLYIPISKIKPDPNQPRKFFDEEKLAELKKSISEIGLQNPLHVKPSPTHTEDGTYLIVAGERRWRACQELSSSITTLPCLLHGSEVNALVFALAENIQRQSLLPVEEALGYKRLMDEQGLNHTQIGMKVGILPTKVSRMLQLLLLPPQLQNKVGRTLSVATATELIKNTKDPAEMLRVISTLAEINHGISRISANIVKTYFGKAGRPRKKSESYRGLLRDSEEPSREVGKILPLPEPNLSVVQPSTKTDVVSTSERLSEQLQELMNEPVSTSQITETFGYKWSQLGTDQQRKLIRNLTHLRSQAKALAQLIEFTGLAPTKSSTLEESEG